MASCNLVQFEQLIYRCSLTRTHTHTPTGSRTSTGSIARSGLSAHRACQLRSAAGRRARHAASQLARAAVPKARAWPAAQRTHRFPAQIGCWQASGPSCSEPASSCSAAPSWCMASRTQNLYGCSSDGRLACQRPAMQRASCSPDRTYTGNGMFDGSNPPRTLFGRLV